MVDLSDTLGPVAITSKTAETSLLTNHREGEEDMAKFIATKDGRFINVAAIGEVKPTSDWTTWVAADLQGQHLATLHANFEPAVELAEIIPAAPGTTCLVVFPDRDALDVFHEIYAVIGWRCGDVDAVEPVLIEPVPAPC